MSDAFKPLSKPGPDYYTDLQHTPFGFDLTFDFARAALEGEKLGKRGVTDLLGISISPTDFARQLTTIRATNAPSRLAGLAATARFGRFFAGVLFDTYLRTYFEAQ